MLVACSPLVLAWRAPVRISGYHGDGAISRIPHPLNPGFKVDFEEFSLSKPYRATYRVGGLPQRRRYDAYRAAIVVGLTPDEDAAWPPMPAWVTSRPVGTMTLTLRDPSGTMMFHGSHEIASLRWKSFIDDLPYGRFHSPRGEKDPSWTLFLDSVDLEHQSPAELEADYVPGPDAPDRLARVRILAGGFE
ncbi:MAG TPA: hypothetical protein VGV60_04015 [Candidatus Polarisedimenticolia bacterium]|jgi:hypothetical protein|nr:hypothetical protein [Candidatus Polarisedimenticolia bacterium]